MNKTELVGRIARPASLFLLIAMLAACGGGGGGGNPDVDETPDEGGGGSSLPTGYFTRTVEATGSFWVAPFNGAAVQFFRLMQMYRASDINGSGDIVAIRFQRENGNPFATTCPNTTIRLAHTSREALTETFADNVEEGKGSSVTVIDDEALVIPEGPAGTYFDIPVGTPFHYNGVDNLIVELTRSTACSSTVSLVTDANVGYFARVSSQVSDSAVSGTVGTGSISAAFVFEGGENKVDFGTPDYNSAPLSTNVDYQKVQMLYNASAIDGSGPITGIGLQVHNAVAGIETYTYTIKLGHTSLTDLTTVWADNINVGSPVTMANSTTFTVPAGVPAGEFIWLPVPDGIFEYNGTDNLVVELTVEDASGNVALSTHTATGQQSFAFGPAANAAASGTAQYVHQIALRFHGSTIDRVSVDGAGDPWVFPVTAAGLSSQTLYLSSDLGTGGTITKLACRMNTVSSTEIEYTNFQVVMSHTEATALVEEMAANLTDPVVVFEDGFTVPAGLLRGDWIEIPLSTAFEYDGARNLVIQTRSDAGTMGHACIAKEGAIRYEDQYGAGVTRDSAVAGLMSYQRDLRLWISK